MKTKGKKTTTRKTTRKLLKLSKTSKLHCKSLGLLCDRWPKRHLLPNDHPCKRCYAATGTTRMDAVYAVLEHNYNIINTLTTDGIEYQAQHLAKLLARQDYFRWHHAGNLLSTEHWDLIIRVCELTPNTLHWLPLTADKLHLTTKFYPANLTIRLSHDHIDEPSPYDGIGTTVYTQSCPKGHYACPNGCGIKKTNNCRVCWDTRVRVGYKFHADAIVLREARKAGLDV